MSKPAKEVESVIAKVRQILEGIDETETCSSRGWWETSAGAEFGKKKLDEVIQAVASLGVT